VLERIELRRRPKRAYLQVGDPLPETQPTAPLLAAWFLCREEDNPT